MIRLAIAGLVAVVAIQPAEDGSKKAKIFEYDFAKGVVSRETTVGELPGLFKERENVVVYATATDIIHGSELESISADPERAAFLSRSWIWYMDEGDRDLEQEINNRYEITGPPVSDWQEWLRHL